MTPIDPRDRNLLTEAAELVVSTQAVSHQALQRKLRVGYAQAHHLIEALRELGVVGPPDLSTWGDVLVRQEELETVLDLPEVVSA